MVTEFLAAQASTYPYTRAAEPVRLVRFWPDHFFCQLIIFIFAVITFIKIIFGIPVLIVLNDNVLSIFDVRNYQQKLTDAERVLPNEVVAKRNTVLSTTSAVYE